MPSPLVTPPTANVAGDMVRKNLEMVLARAAQGGANALLGGPVNAAAAAPLFMSRYLMAGLANIGNIAALNGGGAPAAAAAAAAGGVFGGGNPTSVYSAMTAAGTSGVNMNSSSVTTDTALSDSNTGGNSGNNSHGETIAIDLSLDSKVTTTKACHTTSSTSSLAYQAYMSKAAAVGVTPTSSSSSTMATSQPLIVNGASNLSIRKSPTAGDESDKNKQYDSIKHRKIKPASFTRSVSLDPSALDNSSIDSDLPLSLTTSTNRNNIVADFSKTSLLSVQVPQSAISETGSSWKQDENDSSEDNPPENFLGVMSQVSANCRSGTSKSHGSSPSPVPSPTSSDTSADRKATTTSLSRTHSRLVQ